MGENSTKVKRDVEVIQIFRDRLYDQYVDDSRVDIPMENTEFGVGDKYDEK